MPDAAITSNEYTDTYDWCSGSEISTVQTLPTNFKEVCDSARDKAEQIRQLKNSIQKQKETDEGDLEFSSFGDPIYTKDAYMNTEYKINSNGFVDGGITDTWAKNVAARSKKNVRYISAMAFSSCLEKRHQNAQLEKFKSFFKKTTLPNKIYINQHEGVHYRLYVVDCQMHKITCYDGYESNEATLKSKSAKAMDLIESLLWEKSTTSVLQDCDRLYILDPPWRDNCCATIVAVLVLYDLYNLTDMAWHREQVNKYTDWYLYWRCRIAYELISGEYAMINGTYT